MRGDTFYVYILTNAMATVLYTGVTNDLPMRIAQHRTARGKAFTARYGVHRLVYVETYRDIRDAIRREKQIKGWKRERKEQLIRSLNPRLADLAPSHRA